MQAGEEPAACAHQYPNVLILLCLPLQSICSLNSKYPKAKVVGSIEIIRTNQGNPSS